MTYRMCCLTVGDSPSFVNREVAAWIEGQAKRNPSYLRTRKEGQEKRHMGSNFSDHG